MVKSPSLKRERNSFRCFEKAFWEELAHWAAALVELVLVRLLTSLRTISTMAFVLR